MISGFRTSLLVVTALMAGAACAQDTSAANDAKSVVVAPQTTSFESADNADWRTVAQENLLYIDTDHGLVVVELFPEIAPLHVKQIKALTKQGFYDYITFHRVIDRFMNQTGDPTGTGAGDSEMPDIPAEFTFRRSPEMKVTLLDKRLIDANNAASGAIDVGYYKGAPVATQPAMQAALTADGRVEAWGLHCPGVASMARASELNSANSQFFLMRGNANFLDRKYSIWGNTVYGRDVLTKFKVGTRGEDPNFIPDNMKTVRLGSDLPENKQLNIQVLRTDALAFKTFLSSFKAPNGTYADICDILVPTRVK